MRGLYIVAISGRFQVPEMEAAAAAAEEEEEEEEEEAEAEEEARCSLVLGNGKLESPLDLHAKEPYFSSKTQAFFEN